MSLDHERKRDARAKRIKHAETAIRELRLGALSVADHRRIDVVERALRELDDVQADLKVAVEEALYLLRPQREHPFVALALERLEPLVVPVSPEVSR